MVVGLFVAILAMLIPLSILDEMVSVGTLLAFVLVSAGVLVMRRTHPRTASSLQDALGSAGTDPGNPVLDCIDHRPFNHDADSPGQSG